MGSTGCHRYAACAASSLATATAILLWGVGAESVHFRDYLPGSLLLVNALIVTLLESLTAWQYLEWRRTRYQSPSAAATPPACRPPPKLLSGLDTYRRAAVYAVLSVPCFVHLKRLWLPLVPGVMLLLSSGMYMVKYCCAKRRQRSIVKVPTFVRFKDESVSAESGHQSQSSAADQQPHQLSHQSSFASSHSGCSLQMGSKDSGIEASQRDVGNSRLRDYAKSDAKPDVAAAPNAARKSKGLMRAYSSSPDRCCLINEDSLSLRD